MFKFFDKVKKSKAGYTLTELIVVVAILGILAAVGIPMIMNSRQEAENRADEASISIIESAVQTCLADGTLKTTGSNKIDTTIAEFNKKIRARLVGKEFPTCNSTKQPVWYLDLDTGKVYKDQAGSSETQRFKLTNVDEKPTT